MSHRGPSILFLTKYARNGASSRYRCFQYLPWFERVGIVYEVLPLLDESYVIHRYDSSRRHAWDILRAFLRRLAALYTARSFDLVVIEYELLPYFPALPERLLGWLGVSYVVDYDDALFHQYDQHRNCWVRWLLGEKIARVMRGALMVTVGNAYLADYAQRAGARRIEIIPTVIDLTRYPRSLLKREEGAVFTIGWIGSPSTSKYLMEIAPALKFVCTNSAATVKLIGSGPVNLPGVSVEIHQWNYDTEVELLQQFDVGIMPLPDNLWERGKCGLKLIQYMACGLPVIASPVGINNEIVESGVNGYLAETTEEWVNAIYTLMNNKQLRYQMGLAGRKKVEECYSLQVSAPKLAHLLSSIETKE